MRATSTRRRCTWFTLAILAGCATAPPMPDPPPTHPASPLAAEAAAPPASTTLTMPARTPKGNTGAAPRPRGH
ncbi:MAG TPA: hypothetical protein VF384_19860 [Planctomycetota bacterium]